MAEHLEVLRAVLGRSGSIVERAREADALDRRLRDAADGRRRLDPERIQYAWHHVDSMSILRANFALGSDAPWPVDDEGVTGAATIGLALPAAERRVAGPGPTPRVVVERLGPAQLVELGQALLQRLLGVVVELHLISCPCGTALGAGVIVVDLHYHSVYGSNS